MFNGYLFLLELHNSITPNQNLGGEYQFIKWLSNGGLQFKINDKQKKSIPPEVIVIAYHIHKRNKKIKSKIIFNQVWLKSIGHSDWCFISVLNYLIKTYDKNKS
jgi:hypothetical protein